MRPVPRRPEVVFIDMPSHVSKLQYNDSQPRSVPEIIPLQKIDRLFRFCRMFKPNPTNASTHIESYEKDPTRDLIRLAQTMKRFTDDPRESEIPAGYIYLMQFINHDIIFDKTQGISGPLERRETQEGRSPTLSLDSVYGRGPAQAESKAFYERDGIRLRLGCTTNRHRYGVDQSYPSDLPRLGPYSDAPGQAVIGNLLNDGNIALAQTHVAFLKFHNAIVTHLEEEGISKDQLFETAREKVTQHYQSIVLHDVAERLADPDVYEDVMHNGPQFFLSSDDDVRPALPVEFAFSVFRVGHSMVRDMYEWNEIHRTGSKWSKGAASLPMLSRLSQLSGDLGGFHSLPSDWIIDWRRFYDFDTSQQQHAPKPNAAHLIDTNISGYLHALPGFTASGEAALSSLAVLDLLGGFAINLPTGQDIVKAMQIQGTTKRSQDIKELTPTQLCSDDLQSIDLTKHQKKLYQEQLKILHQDDSRLIKHTPLWYYILKEAKEQQGGKRLGQVGSYILVETLYTLIQKSPYSILKQENWKTETGKETFSMPELLTFINDKNREQDELNPISRK